MTIMNADESVAHGCTLMCTILSPTLKIKEFKIQDCQPYPTILSWQESVNEDNEVEVFSRWNVVPSAKMLSFYKQELLTVEARYSYPNDIPFSELRIGQYIIEKIQPQPDGTPSKIKVKVCLDHNGILDVTQTSLIETIEEPNAPADPEEAMETATFVLQGAENGVDQIAPTATEQMEDDDAPTNTAVPGSDDAQEENKKKDEQDNEGKQKTASAASTKRKKKEIDLSITSRIFGANKNEIKRVIEQELEIISQDKKQKEFSDAKNAVEEYIYDMRVKIDGDEYENYSDDITRQKLVIDLQTIGDWLYDEGINQEKNIYAEYLKNLKNLGDSIRNRYNESENRQQHMQGLMKSIQQIDEATQTYHTKPSDRYSHFDQKK